jgi:hypothetical protein
MSHFRLEQMHIGKILHRRCVSRLVPETSTLVNAHVWHDGPKNRAARKNEGCNP